MSKKTFLGWALAASCFVASAGYLSVKFYEQAQEQKREDRINRNKQILGCTALTVQSRFDITKKSMKYDYLVEVLADSASSEIIDKKRIRRRIMNCKPTISPKNII